MQSSTGQSIERLVLSKWMNLNLQILDNLRISASDHFSVCCNIDTTIEKVTDTNASTHSHVKGKVHWSKLDAEKFVEAVKKSLSAIDIHSDLYEMCS